MSEKDMDVFSRCYPHLKTIFLRRCILGAIHDRDFFESVYFGYACYDKVSSHGKNNPKYNSFYDIDSLSGDVS